MGDAKLWGSECFPEPVVWTTLCLPNHCWYCLREWKALPGLPGASRCWVEDDGHVDWKVFRGHLSRSSGADTSSSISASAPEGEKHVPGPPSASGGSGGRRLYHCVEPRRC